MTIAIVGQQKYDLQDLVCVEVMLRFRGLGRRFLVEPVGGEDAELELATAVVETVEIQVKGALGSIGLSEIVACLAHTPAREVGPTLLQRLLEDPSRMALLVMSGRCTDAAAMFVPPGEWKGSPHPVAKIKLDAAKSLLTAFAMAEVGGKADGALRKARVESNAAFSASAEPKAVRNALARVVVLDRVSEDDLLLHCRERLRREHLIPEDRLDDVLLALRDAVKVAKARKVDAFPLADAILRRERPDPLLPVDSLPRGDEEDLAFALSSDGVLLLSGKPRVGKTEAARRVAAMFRPQGFEVRELADVDEADRFLRSSSSAPRLALLDDPFGGVRPDADAADALRKLGRLIAAMPTNARLIVAQGEGPLLDAARLASLDHVVTAGYRWRDLSAVPAKLSSALWSRLVAEFDVPSDLATLVADALASGELHLEPGCVERLAADHERLPRPFSLESIERLARADADELGRLLAQEGFEDLLTALAIGTSRQEAVSPETLAFLCGSGGDSVPGVEEGLGTIYVFGGSDLPEVAPPTYESQPVLSGADEDAIERLERRRILSRDRAERIAFSHPVYRAAAEALLRDATSGQARRAVRYLERALLCLSPPTTRAAARNLRFVYEALSHKPMHRKSVVDLAVRGLGSFFPATRDLCFGFLIEHFEDFQSAQREDLPRWIAAVADVELADLHWSEGEAHLPFQRVRPLEWAHLFDEGPQREEIEDELALLGARGGDIEPERAAKALRYLLRHRHEMNATIAQRLLEFDEAVLRAAAIGAWVREPRLGDEEILRRISEDAHPICVLALYKGLVRGWSELPDDRRAFLLGVLAALSAKEIVAAFLIGKLVVFDRVEHTGENPPWAVFLRLLPIVLQALPLEAALTTARLFNVVHVAVDHVEPQAIVLICDQWLSWLKRIEDAGGLPDDFALGVADLLLDATAQTPDLRAGRVEALLSFRGTGATMRIVADLVDGWDVLTRDERNAVLDRLRADRTDRLWMQATVLTRENVPAELQAAILGAKTSLEDGADVLLERLDAELLAACIHIQCGKPQPLWYLGVHHRSEVWEAVVELVARRPDHPLFELAFADAGNEKARLARVVADLAPVSPERALELLIAQCIEQNAFFPEAWAELLSSQSDATTLERWYDRMAEAAPLFLDRLGQLKFWLRREIDREALRSRFAGDVAPIVLLHEILKFEGASRAELLAQALGLITLMLEKRTIRLYGTHDRLADMLDGIEAPELKERLANRAREIRQSRDAARRDLRRPEKPLAGWIPP